MNIYKVIPFLAVFALFSCDVSGVKKNNLEKVVDDTEIKKELVVDTAKVDNTMDSVPKRLKETLASGVTIVWTNKDDAQPRLKSGDVIKIRQVGRLSNGKVFDSWKQIGTAPSICLGYKMAVEGWEQGLYKMGVGEKAKISVPAALGYGSKGYGDLIPPNSDLIYEVEIVENIQPIVLEKDVKVFIVDRAKDSEKNGSLEGNKIEFGYMAFAKGKGMYDNSYKNGMPFTYNFGKPTVVPGLNIAMPEIREKDKAYVQIPASMAYGKKGLQNLVGPNTPILYDIMLMKNK